MTQEEKKLLLVDISARLPYGVICQVDDGAAGLNDGKLVEIDISKELVRFDADYYWDAYIDDIKPYLRPMSNMTEEEEKEFNKVVYDSIDIDNISPCVCVANWLYSKCFDVYGLIPKGLAIEATEGMYK
jgi:hypothetical protein